MLKFHVVIPARFASTRLPGKALLPISGKPMVVRVAEQAAKSGAQQIWIATDHHAIAAAAHEHGFQSCLTGAHHASGTDRIAEVVEQHNWPDDTVVVNVQGDEPLIPPELIRAVALHLHDHPECAVATACHPIRDVEMLRNPNIVKAVLDKQGNALYFSRAPIPWPRDAFAPPPPPSDETTSHSTRPPNYVGQVAGYPEGRAGNAGGIGQPLAPLSRGKLPENFTALRHIGIYAYRAGFLRIFRQLAPAAVEQIEALEQLRALWHGYKIGVTLTREAPPGGVDTEQDLHAARKQFDAAYNPG